MYSKLYNFEGIKRVIGSKRNVVTNINDTISIPANLTCYLTGFHFHYNRIVPNILSSCCVTKMGQLRAKYLKISSSKTTWPTLLSSTFTTFAPKSAEPPRSHINQAPLISDHNVPPISRPRATAIKKVIIGGYAWLLGGLPMGVRLQNAVEQTNRKEAYYYSGWPDGRSRRFPRPNFRRPRCKPANVCMCARPSVCRISAAPFFLFISQCCRCPLSKCAIKYDLNVRFACP